MQEVTVSVVYKGKNYLTNVIANKGSTANEILSVATEQVRKQWNTPQKIWGLRLFELMRTKLE